MKGRVARWLLQALGLALIALLVSWVGWLDRVEDPIEGTRYGHLLAREPGRVLLLPQDGAQAAEWIPIADPGDAHAGLRGVLLGLAGRPGTALLGLLLHAAGLALTFLRWGALLRGAALPTPASRVLRLCWIANFTSMLLPGGVTTGDLVRGVGIARDHAQARTRAVLTIVLDRFLGLLSLGAVTGAALLFAPRMEELRGLRVVLLVLLLVAGLALLLLFSPRARSWTALSRVTALLPFPALVAEVGGSLEMYRRRPGALLLSWSIGVAGQVAYLSAFFAYASAMGASLPLLAIGAGIPAALLIQAVPGLPGGWGLGDVGFVLCLGLFGVAPGAALALSLTQRALHTLLVLPGGLLLARSRRGGGSLQDAGGAV